MKLIKKSGLFLSLIVLLVACNKVSYRKTTGGMPYQLFKGDGKRKIVAGDIMKYHVKYKVGDSVWFSSFGTPPVYTRAGQSMPYDISELWTSLAVGDSIITTQMLDTFIKRSPDQVPKEFKKGERLITYIKILDIFKVDSMVIADEQMEQKKFGPEEIARLEKYLADKKITAQKTPSGAFVEIKEPGTGPLIDSGKYVYVNYDGVTMAGKKFDSNMDPKFGHVMPLTFVVGAGKMVKGFEEPMRFLKLGAKAKVYVPSMIAYGANPDPQSGIRRYETLIFDLSVIDVKDKAPAEVPPVVVPKVDPTQPKN